MGEKRKKGEKKHLKLRPIESKIPYPKEGTKCPVARFVSQSGLTLKVHQYND